MSDTSSFAKEIDTARDSEERGEATGPEQAPSEMNREFEAGQEGADRALTVELEEEGDLQIDGKELYEFDMPPPQPGGDWQTITNAVVNTPRALTLDGVGGGAEEEIRLEIEHEITLSDDFDRAR